MYYFRNLCQPDADIANWLISQPAVISGGYSTITTAFSANVQTLAVTDLSTNTTANINQTTAFVACDPGTQAMSMTGISNEDKTDFSWLMVLVLLAAWSLKNARIGL